MSAVVLYYRRSECTTDSKFTIRSVFSTEGSFGCPSGTDPRRTPPPGPDLDPILTSVHAKRVGRGEVGAYKVQAYPRE